LFARVRVVTDCLGEDWSDGCCAGDVFCLVIVTKVGREEVGA
jgi:hypothetical protein